MNVRVNVLGALVKFGSENGDVSEEDIQTEKGERQTGGAGPG